VCIQVASFVSAWIPKPPGSPASEAPSPQSRNTLLNETGCEVECVRDRNIEKVASVTVALVGIWVRLNAINPRRKLGTLVFPAKR